MWQTRQCSAAEDGRGLWAGGERQSDTQRVQVQQVPMRSSAERHCMCRMSTARAACPVLPCVLVAKLAGKPEGTAGRWDCRTVLPSQWTCNRSTSVSAHVFLPSLLRSTRQPQATQQQQQPATPLAMQSLNAQLALLHAGATIQGSQRQNFGAQ
jgi:hypothetical protein